VAPRAHTFPAFVRPRFGTAPVEWDFAIVDALLVTRLGAETWSVTLSALKIGEI
jgi:hypothetical protein